MKYTEVLEKLKQGWILEKYSKRYGPLPQWQLTHPNPPHFLMPGGSKKDIYGVVYHQTAEKIIKLSNVKLIRNFPAETYKWIEDKDEN